MVCYARKNKLAALVLSGLAVGGCGTPTIKTSVDAGPNNIVAAKLKRVAVMPFQGAGGEQVALQLESMLAQAKHNMTAFYTVVDRRTLQNAVNELKLNGSGLVDPSTVAKLGKFVGVEGIYTGTTFAPAVSRQIHNEDRYQCADSGFHFPCKNTIKTTVNCTDKVVQFTIVPRLVSVETAQIVYASTKTAVKKESFCSDFGGETPDSTLMDQAATEALLQIRDDVAPHTYSVELHLKTSDDGLSDGAKKKLSDAIVFARENRMDRACSIWSDLENQNKGSITINYNLAICDEVNGRLQNALSKYQMVDRFLDRPDKDINDALIRVQKALIDRHNQEVSLQAPDSAMMPVTNIDKGSKIPTTKSSKR